MIHDIFADVVTPVLVAVTAALNGWYAFRMQKRLGAHARALEAHGESVRAVSTVPDEVRERLATMHDIATKADSAPRGVGR